MVHATAGDTSGIGPSHTPFGGSNLPAAAGLEQGWEIDVSPTVQNTPSERLAVNKHYAKRPKVSQAPTEVETSISVHFEAHRAILHIPGPGLCFHCY